MHCEFLNSQWTSLGFCQPTQHLVGHLLKSTGYHILLLGSLHSFIPPSFIETEHKHKHCTGMRVSQAPPVLTKQIQFSNLPLIIHTVFYSSSAWWWIPSLFFLWQDYKRKECCNCFIIKKQNKKVQSGSPHTSSNWNEKAWEMEPPRSAL